MAETKVDISKLKTEGSDLIKELAEFLKEKTNSEVETTTNEIIMKSEEKTIPRSYVRVLLRKFLHRQELKEFYRIIGGKDNTLVVKEKAIQEEEE
jgi:hypothetical protein